MTFTSLIAFAAEAAEHGSSNVMLETIWYPVVAIVTFALLAMVTLSYRHVANRHSRKADAYAREHGVQVPEAGRGH